MSSSRKPPPSRTSRSRRKPKQERALFTAASVLEATELLARQHGFHKLETARIAATAGVSVGSLYQYFANLEAILLALFEQRSAEVAYMMKAAMVKALDQPPERALSAVMWLILRLHEKHHLILHQMIDEVPQLKLSQHPASLRKLVHGSVSAYLQHQRLALNAASRDRKVFFLENIVLGCVRSYLSHPGKISKRAFVADLTRICATYIEV